MRYYKLSLLFFAFLLIISCTDDNIQNDNINFREEMRKFVEEISLYAKNKKPGFIIIPQNAHDIITSDGKITGTVQTDYFNAIDGMGIEDLFYGYNNDDEMTPVADTDEIISFLDIAISYGKKIMVTDYCSAPANINDSYGKNISEGYI